MKNIYRFIPLLLMLFMQQMLVAQVNIQVTVLPPYQSNITLYGSRPDLVMINLVNTSSQELSIQLHGTIRSDNGISLSTKASARSSQPIILPPLGTTQLNGMEVTNIFDFNQIDMVGIREQDFISGSGLPEGMYNFCIQAFDYQDLSQPLSADEPQGCTILNITSSEPPIITSPYEDQEISKATGPMGFNISWMTVGAPPGVYYNLKLVEVLGNQNPRDVFESASPIFEMPVHSNFYFYGPQNPQLVAGRQYVLAVQAVDPYGLSNFRNNGQSELVVFSYEGEDIWAMADSVQAAADRDARADATGPKEGDPIEDTEYATNRIRGKLLWGFVGKYEHIFGKTDHSSILLPEGTSSGAMATLAGTTIPGLNNIVNTNGMQKQDPTSVGMPGISIPGMTIPGQTTMGGSSAYNGLPMMNTRGIATIAQGYNSGKSEAPQGEAPLPGVYVTIKGIKSHEGEVPTQTLLGTAKSDDNGNFEVVLTDPKYADLSGFNKIVMQVNSDDFERYEYSINPYEFAANVNIEIGDHILSAKTFVFEPSFLIEDQANYSAVDSELEVTVYRRASEIEEHAYLQHEGDLDEKERVQKRIDSKNLIPVSRKTITLQDQQNGVFPKLFYSSSLHVEVLPKENYIKERNEDLSVNKSGAVAGQELVLKPEYILQMNVPAISGTVRAAAGGGASTAVYGAYVQVTFDENDRVTSSNTGTESSTSGSGNTGNSGSGNSGSGNGGTTNAYGAGIGGWGSVPLIGGDSVYVFSGSGLGDGAGLLADGAGGQASGFPSGQDLLNSAAAQELNDFAKGPGLQAYTSRTYDNGEYTIKHLPLLKKGAKYKVQLIEVPAQYRHMKVDTTGRDMSVDIFADNHTLDFMIDATLITLKGQLIDEGGRGVYMENVRFRNGASFNTQADGTFEQEMIVQNQTLDIQGKLGFLDTALAINIPDLNNPGKELNIGKISLKRKVSKSLFTVIEKNKADIRIAGVEIQVGDTSQRTNAQGQWLYEGPGNKTLVTFIPPAESGYVATQLDIDLDGSGAQKEYTISLEKGVKLFGKVESGGTDLADSDIQVDEKDYLTTKTDAEGKYAIYVPKSARQKSIRAAKSGYYSDTQEKQTEDAEVELNFVLKDGGGRNISTLLGFDIQLDKSEDKDDKAIWSGKFVNMKSSSDVFEGSRPQQLAFNNLEVSFDATGNALPKDNKVVTDAKLLKLKLFDYLPIFMAPVSTSTLVVEGNPDHKGSLSGELQIDVTQWVKNDIGINVGRIKNAQLRKYNSSQNASVEVFYAGTDRTFPQVDFVLSKKDTADISIELFGFKMNMDLTKSIISQNGFSTKGYVQTPDIGIVKADSIAVDLLKISRQFGLEEIKFTHDLPDIEIGNWVAKLGKVSMDEFGFKLDGDIDLSKKAADKEGKGGVAASTNNAAETQNSIAFTSLSFTNNGLFGGSFTLPTNGISVLGIVNAKQGATPMTFQKKDDVYTIGGSAKFKFAKLLKKEVEVSSFQVQSDGHFFVNVPTSSTLDLGFASYSLKGVEIRNRANEAPSVNLRGEFKVAALNAFKMEASDISFVLDRRGNVDYKIDSIAAEFKTPIFEAGFALGILDSVGVKGFNGSGNMGIPSTPINAALEFAYHKYDKDENDKNQFFLQAGFRSGAIIPIGAVTIDSAGGGFSYNSKEKEFAVLIGGNASILNMKHIAQLKDIKLGVTSNSGANSGVIIHGETNVVVGSIVNLAKASVTLNTLDKQFVVNVDGQFSPVENLAKMQVNGDLIVQWHEDDTYVFLGAHADANLAGIIKGQADFALGVNVKSPRTHPKTSRYFTKLDPSLAQNTFTGAYVNGFVEKNIDFKADIWIAAAKLKLESKANAAFFMNFAGNKELMMRMDGRIHLEANLSILKWNVIGAKAGACYGIGGGYQQSLGGWNFDGYAAAYARIDILRPHSCNNYTAFSTDPGATVCFHAHGHMQYRNNSFSIRGGIGKEDTNNCPQ